MLDSVVLDPPTNPSMLLQVGFIALSVAVTAFFGWWSRRPAIMAGWLLLTGAMALLGWFSVITLPPLMLVCVMVGLVSAVIWYRRGNWRRLPLKLLVGYQAYRILVELLIHQAVTEGVSPEQMTWTGLNFDMLAGITALLLFPFADRLPKWALLLWNTVCLGLLLNVVTVGILSLPLPIQQFEALNGWIAFFPFHWLPMVLVVAAAMGHIALYHRLREDRPNRV